MSKSPVSHSHSFSHSRRKFIKGAIAIGGLNILPGGLYAQGQRRISPNEKINIANIGVGGMGGSAVSGCSKENLVAFCDVDDKRAARVYKQYPKVPHYRDYRELFEKHGSDIDAVTVSTPDHAHFMLAMAAVELGKHVYVEKPLCQTIDQTRKLQAAASKAGIKTQMGNQGHSRNTVREYREWNQAGLLGEVQNITAWTNRPTGWWKQGMQSLPKAQKAPDTLGWDLWRHGIKADYSPDYLPFLWRGWTTWGTGSLGDMACHILDPVFYALDLGIPDWIQCDAKGGSQFAFPNESTVTYHFPARPAKNGSPATPERTLTWYEGKDNPPPRPPQLEKGRQMGNKSGGTIAYGNKETIMSNSHASVIRAIPAINHKGLMAHAPEKTIRRVRHQAHFMDWHRAIRGEVDQASSYFDYSGQLNELVLLGSIAQRIPGVKLQWDSVTGRFKNSELGNKMVVSAVV